MSKDSKIEWTDHTFNPWWGCSKISAACKNCYAETFAKRTGRDFTQRTRTKGPWRDVIKWDAAAGAAGIRQRVFVGSMCDVFEDRDDLHDWRIETLELLEDLENLDCLFLTKRPKVMARYFDEFYHELPQHFWTGCTVENQAAADKRIPELLRIPAAVRFISVEPMLGRVDLTNYLDGIDWVICGGESGPRARCPHPLGIRYLRDQCVEYGVPFMFKQWGEYAPYRWQSTMTRAGDVVATARGMFTIDVNGQMPAVQQFDILRRVGKHAAGRELDGVVWDEYPAACAQVDPDEPEQPEFELKLDN